MVLDLLLAGTPESISILERRQRLEQQSGEPLWIAPPDGIIDLKRGRMSEKDLLDIAALEKAIRSRESRP